jgi:antitoxin component of MazEF toxin-antitoxin module
MLDSEQTTAAEVEVPPIVAEKYGGSISKALEALVHSQPEIGRLNNDLGQERRRRLDKLVESVEGMKQRVAASAPEDDA